MVGSWLLRALFDALVSIGSLTVVDARRRSLRLRIAFIGGEADRDPLADRRTTLYIPTIRRSPPARPIWGRLTIEGGDIADPLDLIGYNIRWDRDNPVRARLWRRQRIFAAFDVWNWEHDRGKTAAAGGAAVSALTDLQCPSFGRHCRDPPNPLIEFNALLGRWLSSASGDAINCSMAAPSLDRSFPLHLEPAQE